MKVWARVVMGWADGSASGPVRGRALTSVIRAFDETIRLDNASQKPNGCAPTTSTGYGARNYRGVWLTLRVPARQRGVFRCRPKAEVVRSTA